MKIIITGGTGFVGRHIVWRMAAEGWQVIFTGRNARAAQEVMELSPSPVRWVPLEHGSATAQATLLSLAHKATAIIHNAALSSPWGPEHEFERANVQSTREVIHACENAQVQRLIHISTPSVYFNFTDRLGVREQEPLPAPVNHYARTKADAETLVAHAAIAQRVILRPRAIFGPWDNTLMPRLLRVIERGPIPLMRGGAAMLDLTFIDNLIDAIWLATTQPLPRALATYNVSNGEPRRIGQLLALVADAFELPLRTRALPWPIVKWLAFACEVHSRITQGKEPLLTRYGAGVLAFSQTLDISAIRNELGYAPAISTTEGIQRYAHWWKNRIQR